jgi:hypothetical protein
VKVLFSVYPTGPRVFADSPAAVGQFVGFLQLLARTYHPDRVIVGNEPNQPEFWQPQFDPAGQPSAGAAFEALLAQAYDALKAVDPAIVVVAGGPSRHGNDNPDAKDNVSTSPVRFIHDMGEAYRASGRTRPIMDELSVHPYPMVNTDPPSKHYEWPNAGIADLDRIKQAVWDAFNGTSQPVFGEADAGDSGLRLMIGEIGWQVAIDPNAQGLYSGAENVPTIDEDTQAQTYDYLVREVSCDPAVTDLLFFQLVDVRDLAQFQSGLMRADGSRRPSYGAVENAIAATGGRCAGGPPVAWQHTTSVTGAAATFNTDPKPLRQRWWGFVAQAGEDATYRAGIFRVAGRTASLTGFDSARPALRATGAVTVDMGRLVRFHARRLRPGYYVYAVELKAAMNPTRTTFVASRPFEVGP